MSCTHERPTWVDLQHSICSPEPAGVNPELSVATNPKNKNKKKFINLFAAKLVSQCSM